MKAAAQRKAVVMKRQIAAIAASEVCRTVVPVEILISSMKRCNIKPPRSIEGVDKGDRRPPSPPPVQEIGFTPGMGDHRCSPWFVQTRDWRRQILPAPISYRRHVTPIRKP